MKNIFCLSLPPLNKSVSKSALARAVSMILILIVATGYGSPLFARTLVQKLPDENGQLKRLFNSVASLSILKTYGIPQEDVESRGMPPHPMASAAIRPEPPESRSAREARVARLVLNLRGGVTMAPRESIQLVAVPEDSNGNPVHGVAAEWSSLNSEAVTVSSDGEVTALADGATAVTATVGQVSARLMVTVASRASTSEMKKDRSTTARKQARRVPGDPQRVSHIAPLFAHARSGAAVVRPPQFGIIESEQLYTPQNAVGAPPGKTTPGASTRGAAIETIETPGSANFSFSLPVVSLPGRGFDLNFGITYNSRLWTKSLASPTEMTYNMDGGWVAPGFLAGYGYLDNQSEGFVKQFMIRDPSGTRHRMVNVPSGSDTYESDDGTFIKLTVNGAQVTNAVATFPGGMQILYGVGDAASVPRYYPTQITDRNGNFITIGYAGDSGRGPKIDSIRDTLQRYVRFKYSGNDLIAVTAPGVTGQPDRPVMRFYYENISGLGDVGLFQSGIVVNAPPGGTARVIKYIYLPSATESGTAHIGYRYDYSAYGMMYKITKFRGMTISTTAIDYTQAGTVTNEGTLAAQTTYNYHGTPVNTTTGISDAPFYTTRTDDWAGRTSAQPVYSFSVNQASGLSIVTAPDSTIRETQASVSGGYDDGLIERTTVKLGSTVLSDTIYGWEESPQGIIPRLTYVTTRDDGVPAKTKAVVFTYEPNDPYNNIWMVSERDFTTTGFISPTELRRTETTYVTDSSFTNRGLIRLPSIVKAFPGGSSSPIAQTEYNYDEFGLAAAPGIGMMHADPGAGVKRGNLTRTRTYPDITNLANYIDHTATYDIAGNLITAQLDCCQQRSFVYSSQYFHAYATQISTGSGPTLTTNATYDLNTGLTGVVTDENAQQTSFFYNVDSLRPEHVDYADGGRVTFNYNEALLPNPSGGHYYSCITTKLDPTRSVQSYSFYDGRGEVTQTFDNWTSVNGWSTQDIQYDVMGRAFRTGNPHYSSGYTPSNPINPTNFWTTRTFDNLGRVKMVTMPTGEANPSSTTTVQTDYAGTVTTVTDQANKQRRQITDGLGRVVRLHEPDANGSLGTVGSPEQETSYEYDALDNLIHIEQGGQDRYFKYDSISRLTHERQVEQNAPFTTTDLVAGNNQWSRKLEYNSHGLVTNAYDARQIHTQIGYDGLNRPLQITYSDGTPTVNHTYDQARTGFFNQGRLTTVTTAAVGQTPSTTQEFDYERLGRVAGQRQKVGLTSYALTYGYNLAGLLLNERYPSGRAVKYGFDEGGRLSSVTDSAGVPYSGGFTYAPHGGLSSETLGNSAVHTLSYNSRLQASQVKLKQSAAGPELQRFDYSYGQATQATGTVDMTKNNGQIGRVDGFTNGTKQWDQRFIYDSLGRLSRAAEYQGGDNGQLTWQTHYDYDRFGNRQQYQQNINVAYTPVQLTDINIDRNRFIETGPTPTTYDPAGNILSDAQFRFLSYTYDANNRQKSAAGTGVSQSAVYDALGQRVQTSATGVARQMVYDAFGQIVAEYNGGSSLRRENVYRGGQLLGSQEFATPAPAPKNVIWTNVTSNIQVTGNSIQKVSGTSSWYEAGAVSSQAIVAGDGYMEFTPGEIATWRMIGLGNNDTSVHHSDIDYAFCVAGGGGVLQVYESGNLRGTFGTYLATDRLKVAIEGGVVKYYRNSTLIYTSTVAPTYPLQVDTSLNTVNAGVYNVVITSEVQNVNWTNVTSNIQVTGNSIQKVSGTSSWYEAGAVSSQAIVAGDGYMEFTPGEIATWRMIGLGNTDSSVHHSDIDYAFCVAGGGGVLQVYESGNLRGTFGTYLATDRLKVAIEGGVVKYYRNSTLIYTSTVAPPYPLQVDTSLNTVNAGVYNVVITSEVQNVSWTNVTSNIQVTGNSIVKVSGTSSWYEAGAVSSQAIVAGDGYMEFTPGEIATWRMIGLGNNDTSVHHSDIDYAFCVAGGGGVLQVYESGNLRGTFGTYLATDRLKVAIEGGVVKYYRNSTLIYTSTVAPAYPLQVDTSLNTVNSGVYNVVIASARLTPSPIKYVLQDVQGSTRAVMSGSTIVARHDFLPFGEEISSGTGLRTMGQGFGAEDKIRQRYGMTERDDATGLDHTWWRKYENRAGRWTSADPYLGSMSIANPQSFNRYAYVNNDPVNFVDPSGLCPAGTTPVTDPATRETYCIPEFDGGTVTIDISEDTRIPDASDYPSAYGFQPMVLPVPQDRELPIGTGTLSDLLRAMDVANILKVLCNPDVKKAMNKAWSRTMNGTSGNEAGFVLNGSSSSYNIRETRSGNTKNTQKMDIFPDTFLLFHVHPNSGTPNPSTPKNNALGRSDRGDTLIADQYKVLFVVGHKNGSTVYDPISKRVTVSSTNLGWTEECK